jgi:hypothetical protein
MFLFFVSLLPAHIQRFGISLDILYSVQVSAGFGSDTVSIL